ncbi:maleylpyruvate isomerase N-terminal domain-containing protein [Streptomyces parvus]|uniref:maleylpyruvate isomerase N-terminal domain-containing protein n=1 Tax=Streptomyces parvus TaxID=66428 RepID=UPI0035DA51BC
MVPRRRGDRCGPGHAGALLRQAHRHDGTRFRAQRRRRARSEETAAAGPEAVADEARAAWQRLSARLTGELADRRVAVLHRPGEEMLLDGYLRTRCVELAVHLEDLALSVGVGTPTPGAATALAIDVLVAAARERHGDQAVLHALTRRERDVEGALRVL